MVAIWQEIKAPTAPPNEKDPSRKMGKEDAFSNQLLILFSEPLLPETATDSLAIQQEIEAIADALDDVSSPISLDIVVKVATAENVQNIFHQRVKPLIIHFIGHGAINEGNTALVLENKVGIARHFNEQELEIALSSVEREPCQLALINSCHSSKLAEAFVEAKVPHVIAVNAYSTILDETARCFAKSLYKNLFEKNSVKNNYSISRNAVILDQELQEKFNKKTYQKGVNIDEAYKFELLPKAQSHSVELDFESGAIQVINRPNLFTTNLPPYDPKFVGRKQDIQSVIEVFTKSDNRCVVLHGMGGIGKTTLAKAIGRWFQQRDRFRDGVWWINLQDVDSLENLVLIIKQKLELRTVYLSKELSCKKILLLLDDLDKIVNNNGEFDELIKLINYLIENCPYLKILITTREPLASSLELCYSQEVHSMKNWTETLFAKYVPINNRWQDEPNYQENIQRLCLFFDGYPLAIKLAAAYAKNIVNISLAQLCVDLDIAPLKVLQTQTYSSKQKKENSLKVSLEISFKRLSVPAQDLFPFLTYFPGGLSINLAHHVWLEKDTRSTLYELFHYSMVEQYSAFTDDWRVNIPEPVRSYAESKMPPGQSLEQIAPSVLTYYHAQFVGKTVNIELLKAEKSNLIRFLEWGYKNENNYQECFCAKITVSLIDQWQSIEPETNLLSRLYCALEAARKNEDSGTEQLAIQAIVKVEARPAAKDILAMAKDKDGLETFSFEVVTVNEKGEDINRQQKEAEYYTEDLGNGVTLDLVSIPGGNFMMGSPEGEGYDLEKPQHQVTVPSFYMGRYPITQAQWKAVAELEPVERELNPDPSYFKEDYEGIDRWTRPVEQVSWEDAVEFCTRLSQKTGKEYRLPSEAEWEYACRAGTETPFHFGETITGDLANYDASETYASEPKGEYRKKTTPVGSFPPNAFGLYDMHGNVWEWCKDDCYENYEAAPTDGSAWISEISSTKVLRGGSWYYGPWVCRSAYRYYFYPVNRFNDVGFRVACGVP